MYAKLPAGEAAAAAAAAALLIDSWFGDSRVEGWSTRPRKDHDGKKNENEKKEKEQ